MDESGLMNHVFDLEEEFLHLFDLCRTETMTSIERMYALYQATCYAHDQDVPGEMVECGVVTLRGAVPDRVVRTDEPVEPAEGDVECQQVGAADPSKRWSGPEASTGRLLRGRHGHAVTVLPPRTLFTSHSYGCCLGRGHVLALIPHGRGCGAGARPDTHPEHAAG